MIFDIEQQIKSFNEITKVALGVGAKLGEEKRASELARLQEDYAEAIECIRQMFEDLGEHHGLSREMLVNQDYDDGPFVTADRILEARKSCAQS